MVVTELDRTPDDELAVDAAAVTRDGVRIRVPFDFEMPTIGRRSEIAMTWVKWDLQISARGYGARFEVPVSSGSGVAPAVTDERARMFSGVRDSLRH